MREGRSQTMRRRREKGLPSTRRRKKERTRERERERGRGMIWTRILSTSPTSCWTR